MKKILILACIAAASIIVIPAIAQTPVCPKAKTECCQKDCPNKKCTDCVCKDCKDCSNCKDCPANYCPKTQCDKKGKRRQQAPCNNPDAQCPQSKTPNCQKDCVKK